MSDAISKPWYKHPWLWFLIAVPVISVILSFSMLFVALDNKDPEVEGDWHKNKKAIQENFDREHYASALSIQAQLNTQNQLLMVKIVSPYALDKDALPSKINVIFSHPTHENKDLRLVLEQQTDGSYSTSLNHTLTGRYYLDINTKVWRLKEMVEMPLTQAITINPLPLNEQ